MDASNYQKVLSLARGEDDVAKVKLIMNFLYPGKNTAVPDPYYDNGFPKVFEMLNQVCQKIIEIHK
jgi:protein-tyrosine phosphatase